MIWDAQSLLLVDGGRGCEKLGHGPRWMETWLYKRAGAGVMLVFGAEDLHAMGSRLELSHVGASGDGFERDAEWSGE